MKKFFLLAFAVLIGANLSLANNRMVMALGGSVGNGGGFVKTEFTMVAKNFYSLLKGQTIWAKLDGQKKERVIQYQGKLIPVGRIPWVLRDENILVKLDPKDFPNDVNGSVVNALVVDESPISKKIMRLILREDAWLLQLQFTASVERLVCHELMRAIRVNDDMGRVCDVLIWMKGNWIMPIYEDEYYPDGFALPPLDPSVPSSGHDVDEWQDRTQVPEPILFNEKQDVVLSNFFQPGHDTPWTIVEPQSTLPLGPEEQCYQKQYQELILLRDMSSLDPLAKNFQASMNSTDVYTFKIDIYKYPNDHEPKPPVTRLILRKGAKNTNRSEEDTYHRELVIQSWTDASGQCHLISREELSRRFHRLAAQTQPNQP